ncbi:MAG: leader peptidase (prepilin peptidase) / N-methyltransferase [Thermoleophilaceae bacterium]|jgi:leader peptidase (prepilin peptidase)/N-methyltransferase|nr:leader peptidase (prepilin peptidase) / N-methyltransferase [Thermoleophilaceae bacterium]
MEASAAEVIAAGLFGSVIGSFLNVVAWRVPRKESLVSPGSRCPHCGADVKPYDNVPVVSWLLLRGRCRNCGGPISPRYPLVELATALVFAAVVAVRGFDDDLVLELPFVSALIALAAIDFDHKLLPNRIVYPMAVYGVIATLIVDQGDLVENLIAGAGAFLFLLLAVLAYPRGMGMGDVKLAGAMGLYLGLSIIPALLVAFLSGSVVGVVILAREGAQARKKAVPFGVFLALGGIVGVLAGPELIDVYESNFLE